MVKKYSCNPYEGGEVPPCSAFLNNTNPIIKDCNIIFKNENRVFYFISTNPNESNNSQSSGSSSAITEKPSIYTNLQVSLSTFIIGLYINQIQKGEIKYSEKSIIHSDKSFNNIIHDILKKAPEVKVDYIPSLNLVVSNNNAILPFYTYSVNISPLNYYILFIINRMENNRGLFFINNAYATEDPINFCMASLNLHFPCK